MKLKRNQMCPLHRSLMCCGRSELVRKAKPKYESRNGVTRIPDTSHPRGYLERRSPAEMRRLLNRKVEAQGKACGICGKEFEDMREIVPDHIEPRGMGGARRDDHESNIQAAHRACNLEKGSKRVRAGAESREPE